MLTEIHNSRYFDSHVSLSQIDGEVAPNKHSRVSKETSVNTLCTEISPLLTHILLKSTQVVVAQIKYVNDRSENQCVLLGY